METRRAARINKLTQALKNGDRLHLKQAAELLGVSEMTVRRDLNATSASVILLATISCPISRTSRCRKNVWLAVWRRS